MGMKWACFGHGQCVPDVLQKKLAPIVHVQCPCSLHVNQGSDWKSEVWSTIKYCVVYSVITNV